VYFEGLYMPHRSDCSRRSRSPRSPAGSIIVHQLLLIAAGNYAWLNWFTVVLGFSAFSDSQIGALLLIAGPLLEPRALPYDLVLVVLAVVTAIMSFTILRKRRRFFRASRRGGPQS